MRPCNCAGECMQCALERLVGAGGEQGPTALELEIMTLKAQVAANSRDYVELQARSDAWQKRAIAAESLSDEWRRAAQAVTDLFDPLQCPTSPAHLTAVGRGAKQANASIRGQRDQLLADLALLRVPGGAA